jgi:hypothetical protein
VIEKAWSRYSDGQVIIRTGPLGITCRVDRFSINAASSKETSDVYVKQWGHASWHAFAVGEKRMSEQVTYGTSASSRKNSDSRCECILIVKRSLFIL